MQIACGVHAKTRIDNIQAQCIGQQSAEEVGGCGREQGEALCRLLVLVALVSWRGRIGDPGPRRL
jgi:hypothetical protein